MVGLGVRLMLGLDTFNVTASFTVMKWVHIYGMEWAHNSREPERSRVTS